MQIIRDLQPIEKYYFMLLFAPDSKGKFTEPVKGNMWSQKEMFMLSKLVKALEADTEFIAYAMGSFSEAVAEIEDQFFISGFAEKQGSATALTFEGRKLAELVWEGSAEHERSIVSSVKSCLNDLPQFELLALIYTLYPESAVNSILRADVDKQRPSLAMSLLKKGKIELPLALKVARMSQSEFLRFLEKRGVTLAGLETATILADQELLEEIEKSKGDSDSGRLVSWETIKDNP